MNEHYVYVYLDPRKPGIFTYAELSFCFEPFYVGKGKGNRKNVHLQKKKQKGSHPLYDKIRKIIDSGRNPIVVTVKEAITDTESLTLEQYLVESIGRKNTNNGPLLNMIEGGIKNPVLCGKSSPMYGKSLFEMWKKKNGEEWAIQRLNQYKKTMSERKKGTIQSVQTKKRISTKAKDRWKSMDDTEKNITLRGLLNCQTPEKRKQASISMTEMNRSNSGGRHPRSRKVFVEGVEYQSIDEVCKKYGFKYHHSVRYRLLSDKYPSWHYLT